MPVVNALYPLELESHMVYPPRAVEACDCSDGGEIDHPDEGKRGSHEGDLETGAHVRSRRLTCITSLLASEHISRYRIGGRGGLFRECSGPTLPGSDVTGRLACYTRCMAELRPWNFA